MSTDRSKLRWRATACFFALIAAFVAGAGMAADRAWSDENPPIQEGDSSGSSDPNAIEYGYEEDLSDLPTETVEDFHCDQCPPPLDPPPSSSPATVIDRSAIIVYAQQYVGDLQNPASSAGYNFAYKVFRDNDCQNFVSQALKAGGWTNDKVGANEWYYGPLHAFSRSWPLVGGVHDICKA